MPTNSRVAAKFAKGESVTNPNGNMSVDTTWYYCTENDDFKTLAFGWSYRTVVAIHVLNIRTNAHELWMTPDSYSTPTQQHKAEYRRAFYDAYGAGNVFTTLCVNSANNAGTSNHTTMRNLSKADFMFAKGYTNGCLTRMASNKVHQATRQRELSNLTNRLADTIALLTEGTTTRLVNEVAELIDLHVLITSMHSAGATGTRKEHTALLQGYVALENETN